MACWFALFSILHYAVLECMLVDYNRLHSNYCNIAVRLESITLHYVIWSYAAECQTALYCGTLDDILYLAS